MLADAQKCMALETLVIGLQLEDDGQRNRLLVADAVIIAAEPHGRGIINLGIGVSVEIDLRRHTGVAGIAPIGFPSRLQLDLQGAAYLALGPGLSRNSAILYDNADTPAGRFCPGGGRSVCRQS